jgi:hypothetical protein
MKKYFVYKKVKNLFFEPYNYILFLFFVDILAVPILYYLDSLLSLTILVFWFWGVFMIREDLHAVSSDSSWEPSRLFYLMAVPLWGGAVILWYLLKRHLIMEYVESEETHGYASPEEL